MMQNMKQNMMQNMKQNMMKNMKKNVKHNIYIRPHILHNRYILPYKYNQQYKTQNMFVIPNKKLENKPINLIIPYKPKTLSSSHYSQPIINIPYIPYINIPYKQLYNSIITYKHTKLIIGTTISSFIIYKSFYNYIIYLYINTIFDL